MGYYGMRGDYYRGDYYRGDIMGALGGIARGVAGFVTGGPLGAVSAVARGISSGHAPPSGGAGFFPGMPRIPNLGGQTGGVRGFLFGNAPGAKKGKRPKKGEPGYRPRRMHVTNVHALRRAIRRARGFEKLALRVIGFSSPRRHHGRPYFKKKRANR